MALLSWLWTSSRNCKWHFHWRDFYHCGEYSILLLQWLFCHSGGKHTHLTLACVLPIQSVLQWNLSLPPNKVESLLKFACRTVLHSCKFSSASAARCELGISTLSSRRTSISRKLSSSASIPLVHHIFLSFSLPQLLLPHSIFFSSQLNLPAVVLVVKALLVPLCGDRSQPPPDK